jgi:hypothetical protein
MGWSGERERVVYLGGAVINIVFCKEAVSHQKRTNSWLNSIQVAKINAA